jgi:NAD(P)-dependent dehydrogenase (short-subunit alcohol dehydrogenase family)
MSAPAGSGVEGFAGQHAIVTGGASGIGAALCRALAAAGATVVVGDVDLPGAEAVAASCPDGLATARHLDVTDAAAVQAAVDDVVAAHGRLDLMVNNAGISWGSRTEDLSVAQWDTIIDINIRGVAHGVAAAYPVMVRQRSGHIVNTASMGGLMPSGLITSYCMTKHAVVGLSLSLRSEAVHHGVGVTAVCPSAVETRLLDTGGQGGFDGRRFYLTGQGMSRPLDPDDLARAVLRGVQRDDALVIAPARSKITYAVGRFAPGLTRRLTARFVRQQMEAMS